MSTDRKLSQREYEAIKFHNDSLIEAAKKGAAQCRAIPASKRPPYMQGQLRYWIAVVRALKWSTGIAAQSAGVKNDVTADR